MMNSILLDMGAKMQNPYDKYSQNQSQKSKKKPEKKKRSPQRRTKASKKETPVSKPLLLVCVGGLVLSLYTFAYTEEVIDQFSRIRLQMPSVFAQEAAKKAPSKEKKEEKSAGVFASSDSILETDVKKLTMKNSSVFSALQKKKKDLEKKERELARLEEDLHKQKVEIEGQLKELNKMRREISSVLDKKVVADKESVQKLVAVYSNMKPLNAAKIISNIDEELAIKVLSKMKKQNAAAILDFIEPKKAQTLSEKYAGLQKR